MSYQCLDCSYKAQAIFPGGRCPACNSNNIKKQKTATPKEAEKNKKSKVEIFILVLFWGVLLWGIWDRYL